MSGIDRVPSVGRTRIELYPLVDAPHAHEPGKQGKGHTGHPADHEVEDHAADADTESEDNGAYDDHGHLVHEHDDVPPPDIPHIDTVV